MADGSEEVLDVLPTGDYLGENSPWYTHEASRKAAKGSAWLAHEASRKAAKGSAWLGHEATRELPVEVVREVEVPVEVVREVVKEVPTEVIKYINGYRQVVPPELLHENRELRAYANALGAELLQFDALREQNAVLWQAHTTLCQRADRLTSYEDDLCACYTCLPLTCFTCRRLDLGHTCARFCDVWSGHMGDASARSPRVAPSTEFEKRYEPYRVESVPPTTITMERAWDWGRPEKVCPSQARSESVE